MQYIISATEDGAPAFPRDQFENSVRTRWADSVQSIGVGVDGMLTASIKPTTGPSFSIRIDDTGQAIFTDGTPEQVAEVASWAMSLLPAVLSHEMWLYDFNGHTVLPPRVKEQDVWVGWSET